ncbi:MAG: STAS/SEC14 domain-containing protein [Proteobacteria bacterium]|nr:STAS/SEC14 domain-containing protein [Pseudomonadota bacterium]
MIELLKDLPGNVVGAIARGRITKADYDNVLIPDVEAAMGRHEKVRFYYELGADFSGVDVGAAWADFIVGTKYWSRWERVAVVTDIPLITIAVNAWRFVMPAPLRVFATDQVDEARAWILAD